MKPPDVKLKAKVKKAKLLPETKDCTHCCEQFTGTQGVVQTMCGKCKEAGHGQLNGNNICEPCQMKAFGRLPWRGYA